MNSNHPPSDSASDQVCAAFDALYTQRLLHPEAERALRIHVAGCADCRVRLAGYEQLDNALREQITQRTTLPFYTEDIMRSIQSRDAFAPQEPSARPHRPFSRHNEAPAPPHRHGRPRRVFTWVAAVAAVLVIALLATALFVSRHSPGLATSPKVTTTATPALSAPSGVYFVTTSFPSFPSGTMSATIYALKAQDGSVHWQEHVSASSRGWPVLSNGTLYLLADDQNTGSASYAVYAINASNGTIRWHTPIKASAQILQVEAGVVYTGTSAGVVFALNASDGSVLWQRQLSSSEADVRQISNGVVFVSVLEDGPLTLSGSLYALNAADGSVRWHNEPHGDPISISVIGDQVDMVANYSQDSPDEPTVYQTYTFYALDASTGAQRWSYGGTVSKSIYVVSANADTVYLTTSETGSSFTTLLALHASGGAVRWQKSLPEQQIHTPVVLNNTMYLAFDSEVSAVSLLDGSAIWNTTLSGQSFIGQVVNGTLYAITTSALYALDNSNGLVKWRYQAPSPGVHAAVHGVLYGSSVQVDTQQQRVQTSIFALDTSSGKQLWKYDITSAITAPVVG